MRRRVGVGLVVWGLIGGIVGCADGAADGAAATDGGAPSATATSSVTSAASAASAPASEGLLRGVVREQIAVPPYVYLRLETEQGERWAAVAEAPVRVGEPVTVFNAMAMENFTSSTLERTFDRIWFGSLEPPANGVHGVPSPSGTMGGPPTVEAAVGPIEPATGPDARTVELLWAQKEQLIGASASVRGVVVKVNNGVMGKNWLHLQDGSGDPALGTHDLTVTTQATAVVGDTITVTGVVRINQDVGLGYSYALLLEDARIVRR